jgi:deazaflavin-dependent oxidoreductase (nitroreductase family)
MSVKVPPSGSRGAFFPRALAAFGNRISVWRFRRTHSARTQGGVQTFLLETTGAKSGDAREALLGFIEESRDSWLVIASAIGAARHPAWLHNLASRPEATIEFADERRVPVIAETLEGDDLERAWERIALDAPEYVRYRAKTDRDIPVVRLRRAS